MNRRDLQNLSNLRLREAQALFRAREYSGAYYLAGYSIECALKACIAKKYRRHDFPDRKAVNDSYTHDLNKLAVIAGVRSSLQQATQKDRLLERNWNFLEFWSEESRYRVTARRDCKEMLDAIMNVDHGVLPWLIQRW